MTGRDGAELVELMRPRSAIPVHYDDYGVFKSPLADFRREMDARGLGSLVTHVPPGQTHPLTEA